MYFEIEGSRVHLAGTMHRVPKAHRLAPWVPSAIDAARLVYIEHEEAASQQHPLISPWAPRLAQRLPRSWKRIESQLPRATILQLNVLRPRALVSCLVEPVDLDPGVEHLALAISAETHPPRSQIKHLETIAQADALEDKVSDEVWDEAVSWILDNPASSTTLLESSYDAWMAGDVEAIDRISSNDSINRFPAIKEAVSKPVHQRSVRQALAR
jgi:hypothetical protein